MTLENSAYDERFNSSRSIEDESKQCSDEEYNYLDSCFMREDPIRNNLSNLYALIRERIDTNQ